MSDLAKVYDMAALAEASYVLFDQIFYADIKEVEKALQNKDLHGGFSATQAENFVAIWQVVAHQGNTDSGFSATLFKNKKTGEYVYAARGTEPGQPIQDIGSADVGDLVVDGLAFKQIVDMYNDWMRLTTPKGQTYLAAKFDFLGTETTLLQVERASLLGGVVAGPYELSLRNRGDIVIDGPLGTVYKVVQKSSADIFGVNDAKSTGSGAIEPGPAPLTVTGHSLGGHLAVAFTRLFPETGVTAYTINGAGYPTGLLSGLSGNAADNIRNLFTQLGGATAFDPSGILNFYGSAGPEIVTMNSPLGLVQQGGHQEIYIEGWWWDSTFGHGKEQMTDALAVYDLFIRLDKRYQAGAIESTLSELKTIFKAASNTADYSFESLVNTLNKLLVSSSAAPLPTNNREALYASIKQIRLAIDKIPASAVITVDPLPIYSVSTIINMAKGIDLAANDSLAYRYALKELNPFAVRGLDYSNANKNGELNLLNLTTDQGSISEAWIADRAAMLTWVMKANTTDTLAAEGGQELDGRAWNFEDQTTGKKVLAFPYGNMVPSITQSNVIFGNEAGRELKGGNYTDHLYGAGGNDALFGFGGNDYLEGGTGNDRINCADNYTIEAERRIE